MRISVDNLESCAAMKFRALAIVRHKENRSHSNLEMRKLNRRQMADGNA